jgi:hypothetical protein
MADNPSAAANFYNKIGQQATFEMKEAAKLRRPTFLGIARIRSGMRPSITSL